MDINGKKAIVFGGTSGIGFLQLKCYLIKVQMLLQLVEIQKS
jgi:hypothetical protein